MTLSSMNTYCRLTLMLQCGPLPKSLLRYIDFKFLFQLKVLSAFLARESTMLRALYAILRPCVRLSVCHTGGSVESG